MSNIALEEAQKLQKRIEELEERRKKTSGEVPVGPYGRALVEIRKQTARVGEMVRRLEKKANDEHGEARALKSATLQSIDTELSVLKAGRNALLEKAREV